MEGASFCGPRGAKTNLPLSPPSLLPSAAATLALLVVAAAWTRRDALPVRTAGTPAATAHATVDANVPPDHFDTADTPPPPPHTVTPQPPPTTPTAAAADAAATEECHLQPAALTSRVLVSGASNGQPSASACRDACRSTPDCNAWTWCWDDAGCTLPGSGPDGAPVRVPNLGCHLASEPLAPRGAPSTAHVDALAPSSFFSGYLQTRRPSEHTYIRLHAAPVPRVLMLTELPPRSGGGCPAQDGAELALLHVWNKQDYARWHSYEFGLAAGVVDPDLKPRGADAGGQWNKVALLSRALAETPVADADWILYQFFDAAIDDVGFTFPFDSYADKDVILVGDKAATLSGDPSKLDTGALLLRNSDWSRAFIQKLAHDIVHTDLPPPDVVARTDLVAAAITRLLSSPDSGVDASRVRFETDFCMNCDWRRINLAASSKMGKTKAWGDANTAWKLFTTRFFDCQLCYGGVDPELAAKCRAAYREHYEFAYCRFKRSVDAIGAGLARGPPLDHVTELPPPAGLTALGLTPPPVFDFKAHAHTPKHKNTVLRSAAEHATPTANACYASCVADGRCTVWTWCGSAGGCDDTGDWSTHRFPAHGCELASLPQGTPPTAWDRGPSFSSFEMGYITRANPLHDRTAPRPSVAEDRVVVLTGISGTPCGTPWGDYLLQLQLANKADWARLHGYELHQMAETRDPHTRPGAWQKVALIRHALATIPRSRAEWLMWVDMDIIINDVNTTLPLEWYGKKDLVMWGVPDKIAGGDVAGMNSGVLLLRNSDWSRALMDRVAAYGAYPADVALEKSLADALPSYDVGMYEQNALTYLFMTEPALLDRVRFEDAVTLNVWYKVLYSPDVPQPAMVVHFAGCQLCNGFHPEKLGECDTEFVRHYGEAVARLAAVAGKAGL